MWDKAAVNENKQLLAVFFGQINLWRHKLGHFNWGSNFKSFYLLVLVFANKIDIEKQIFIKNK